MIMLLRGADVKVPRMVGFYTLAHVLDMSNTPKWSNMQTEPHTASLITEVPGSSHKRMCADAANF
jgi:hypothetical protein